MSKVTGSQGERMTGAAFNYYEAKNKPPQRTAGDTVYGPGKEYSGPRAGKTQILTLRIANILQQTDIGPSGILALTFTESGAHAMRERLRRYIGTDAYQVTIATFHGFAQQLISRYPDAYHTVIGGRPATDLDRVEVIERIIDGGGVSLLRPVGNPSYYVQPIIHTIATLKQEYVTPHRFRELLAQQEQELQATQQYHESGPHKGKTRGEYLKRERSLAKNRELLAIYEQYQAVLQQDGLYDFADMIVETVAALEHQEDMRRDLQETYQFILADEHQDVNGSQNRILELLASEVEQPNLFVVGDEKQAIYRFQGASLDNFLYFNQQFPDATQIDLTDNYRSGQSILDVAHSLIETDDPVLAPLRVPLVSQTAAPATVEQRHFSHEAIEDEWVTNAVREQIAAGVPPAEIAVIVRKNRDVEAIASRLRAAGVAVNPSADSDILSHPVTQTVRDLIRACVHHADESALYRVLHGAYWRIDAADLFRLLSARSYDRPLHSLITNTTTLQEIGVADTAAVLNVSTVLAEVRAQDGVVAPHRLVQELISHSGLLDHLLATDAVEGTRVLRRLYDEIEAIVVRDGASTLRAVEAVFKRLLHHGLPLNAPYITTDSDAVSVMTAHKSKGLEFTTVFIVRATDGAWGKNARADAFQIPLRGVTSDHDRFADERRLLYVAMTRAKQQLCISYADTNADGRVQDPSRLLGDIDESLVQTVDVHEIEAAFAPAAQLQTAAPVVSHVPPALLAAHIAERGLSATALNNYRKSPWTYFFRNVLRVPEVQNLTLQFGTAMHSVLESTTKYYTTHGAVPDMSRIRSFLERALGALAISDHEYTQLHEKALTALAVYRDHLSDTLPTRTSEERHLTVEMETGLEELPQLRLTGKLDRLDWREDGTLLRVVDYKTGKPKTRNVIEGNTKHSDGDYKRQLVFYALLLEEYGDEAMSTREMCLSFVEPDTKGVIHEETFLITDEDVATLRAELIETAHAIHSGTCLTQPCDPSVCEYCELAQAWQGSDRG